jgi:hypothetical protein
MTYFLAVAAPTEQSQIEAVFGDAFYLKDASGSPIGAAALGHKDGAVVLVNSGHGATHIVSRRKDADRQVVDGIRRLLENVPSVSVLLHLAKGVVLEEPISVRGRRRMTFREFAEIFSELEEDVRYAVVNSWQ